MTEEAQQFLADRYIVGNVPQTVRTKMPMVINVSNAEEQVTQTN
jgi:hypothetical protein